MRIAVLDRDPDCASAVAGLLGESGHCGVCYRDSAALVTALRHDTFDLLLLDWSDTAANGGEVLTWMKAHLQPCPPVIVLASATGQGAAALDLGADDYVTKPLREDVLVARASAATESLWPTRANRAGDLPALRLRRRRGQDQQGRDVERDDGQGVRPGSVAVPQPWSTAFARISHGRRLGPRG